MYLLNKNFRYIHRSLWQKNPAGTPECLALAHTQAGNIKATVLAQVIAFQLHSGPGDVSVTEKQILLEYQDFLSALNPNNTIFKNKQCNDNVF